MNILVIGDACQDIFVYGDCKRMCPEAPVPVFNPLRETSNDGMAGNVKRNLEAMSWAGVACTLVANEEEIIKRRFVDETSNQMLLRVDENDCCQRIEPKRLDIDYSEFDAVVIADYDKGFLAEEDIAKIATRHPLTFLDSKKQLGEWANGIAFIKINKKEYENTKSTLSSVSDLDDKLIVTLGAEGCRHGGKTYPAKQKLQTTDISGAGDTFMAGFVVSYLVHDDIVVAIDYAQECTDKIISQKGVVTI